MTAVLSLLVILTLSILVTRIATLALTHTGLSKELSRFQARSALTGVGFTTGEAEKIVSHPVRRRIVMVLMMVGNAGIITAVSSLILTFVNPGETTDVGIKVAILIIGVTVLWVVASSKWVDRYISRLIRWALGRYTRLNIADYATMLQLVGDYGIGEVKVQEGDWMADRNLRELRLRDEGIVVLGISRSMDCYLGAPDGDVKLCAGDTIIVYGRDSALKEIDERKKGIVGDQAHKESVEEHESVKAKESQKDRNKQERVGKT